LHFVETPVFTRLIREYLDDDAYRAFQLALILRPEQGPLIRGSGGLRKVRAVGRGGVSMKQQAFDELVTNVRQAGRIRRGQARPWRCFG
jgi:hypothetical protein